MALLFTFLLGLAAAILGYFSYYFHHGHFTAERMLQGLSFLSILLMVIVVSTSFLISTFVVTRTNRIARTAQDIMDTGDLSRRIAIDARWDDLGNMAHVLNNLLARMEELVQGIRHVSDNIAHDLRTPLTRLRHQIESLRAQGDGETQNACDAMLAEADGLLGTFGALLRIARIETGRQKTQFAAVALDQVMQDALDLYEPLAEAKHITLTGNLPAAPYYGDRDLLFQIFANLLDNAVKFTPAGGAIAVNLVRDGPQLRAAVTDSGPGIAAAETAKVFDRFYRTEQSRSTPGSGLGLSLVAAAVALHDGTVELQSAQPGLRVVVILPHIK